MPVDDRPLLDRLTRAQLYAEADAHGIEYPTGHPKYIWDDRQRIIGGMVPLLESRGITGETMKTVRWRQEMPTNEEMTAAAHQGMATGPQLYPEAVVGKVERFAPPATEAAQPAQDNGEQKRLAAENEALKSIVEKQTSLLESMSKRLDSLETKTSTVENRATKDYHALYRQCKEAGLPVRKGMRAHQLEEMWDEHQKSLGKGVANGSDAPIGSQRRSEENGVD